MTGHPLSDFIMVCAVIIMLIVMAVDAWNGKL